LSPAMPSSNSSKLNTSDHRQSARNDHASAQSRRTSLPVAYRWSADEFGNVPDLFRTNRMPELQNISNQGVDNLHAASIKR